MKLIEPLASGIRGAENGSFQLYARGTTTAAGYYDSFETDGTFFGGGSGSLDSNGGAAVYVNQFVRVVVSDSDGVIVRDFVAGEQANATEVTSQSFTGVDYTTAASGANKPLSLGAVLDLWKTNSGSIDWKVLLEGTPYTLQNAFAAIPLYYNVKAYGAKGDGATDDTVAIQAAITAAVGAPAAGPYGGIVYFPHGTYKITDALTVGTNHAVSFLGAGSAVSEVIQYTVGKKTLVFTGTVEAQFIQDLGFFNNGNVTANTISVEGISSLSIERCRIRTYSGSAVVLAASGTNGSRLIVRNNLFELGTTPGTACSVLNNEQIEFQFINNTVSATSSYGASNDAWVIAPGGLVLGNRFDAGNLTPTGGTTLTLVRMSSAGSSFGAGPLRVIGNNFAKYPNSGTVGVDWTIYAMEEPVTGSFRVHEFGNSFAGPIGTYKAESLAGATLGYHSARERDVSVTASSASATAALDFTAGSFTYGHPGLIAWGTSVATTFTASARSPGSRQVLVVKNTDVGAHTPAFGAGIIAATAPSSIAAGNSSVWELISLVKPDSTNVFVAFPLKENFTL